MANDNKQFELDSGFKEVELDEGFEPVTGNSLPTEQLADTPADLPANSSTLADTATGIHRGLMLGGAEELSGLGSAIGNEAGDTEMFNKLATWYEGYKTKASPKAMEVAQGAQPAAQKSFYDAYRQGQQAEQGVTDEARKSSPWAFGAGKLAGGLMTGIASAPLAAAAPATTAIGVGALSGGLESEATVENPSELAGDVALGGATGLAFQKMFPGKAPKPQKDILKRGELFPQLETAKKMGEEGIELSAKPEARQALTQRLQENERGLAEQYIAPRKQLGKEVEASLSEQGNVLTQSLDDLDAVKNVEEVLMSNVRALGQGKARELIDKTRQMGQGLLSPQEANALRKELNTILPKIADPEQAQIVKTGIDSVKGVLDNSVPGFSEASRNFAQFAEKGPEALLSKGFEPEIADVFLGDLNKGNLKISEKVRGLLNTIRGGGEQGLKNQGEFFAAMKQLEELAQENPELVKKLGIDPGKLTREFITKADEASVAKKVVGSEGLGQAVYERGQFGLRKATEAGLLKAANKYGQMRKSARDFVSSGADKFAEYAQALHQHGGPDLKSIAENLASEVPQKRNAAIFSVLQLPKAKEILGIETEDVK